MPFDGGLSFYEIERANTAKTVAPLTADQEHHKQEIIAHITLPRFTPLRPVSPLMPVLSKLPSALSVATLH